MGSDTILSKLIEITCLTPLIFGLANIYSDEGMCEPFTTRDSRGNPTVHVSKRKLSVGQYNQLIDAYGKQDNHGFWVKEKLTPSEADK